MKNLESDSFLRQYFIGKQRVLKDKKKVIKYECEFTFSESQTPLWPESMFSGSSP